MPKKILSSLIVLIAWVLLWGCSDSRSQSVSLSAVGIERPQFPAVPDKAISTPGQTAETPPVSTEDDFSTPGDIQNPSEETPPIDGNIQNPSEGTPTTSENTPDNPENANSGIENVPTSPEETPAEKPPAQDDTPFTSEDPPKPELSSPPGRATPGVRSLENLIVTALEPVGSTMYIWGGGWNEADTGAGQEALSIGCSPQWRTFALAQNSSYNYKDYRYRIHDGLDCSGYIGWTLYNVFRTQNSSSEKDGYVMKARSMAETFSGYGWGTYIAPENAASFKPGDICSSPGHVWLCLGTCSDGSVLLLHSNPPGVRLCGTKSPDRGKTQAIALAEEWMSSCYPGWYAIFPDSGVDYSYLTNSALMRWNDDTLADASRFQALSAEEIATYFMKTP